MHIHRHTCGLGGAVAQSESGYHVTLGRRAETGTASLEGLCLYLFPEIQFGVLHLVGLGIILDFLDDGVDLLHLEVDDVVHDALGLAYVSREQSEVKLGILSERVDDIRIEVHCHETA